MSTSSRCSSKARLLPCTLEKATKESERYLFNLNSRAIEQTHNHGSESDPQRQGVERHHRQIWQHLGFALIRGWISLVRSSFSSMSHLARRRSSMRLWAASKFGVNSVIVNGMSWPSQILRCWRVAVEFMATTVPATFARWILWYAAVLQGFFAPST